MIECPPGYLALIRYYGQLQLHFHDHSSAAPHPLQRNLDPSLHPFSKTREFTRAVTAAKMDRMFAKPFVGAIEGHQDGVYCLARDPRRVGVVAGGGGDGGQYLILSSNNRYSRLTAMSTLIPTLHRGYPPLPASPTTSP
jgi:hypothetical protein